MLKERENKTRSAYLDKRVASKKKRLSFYGLKVGREVGVGRWEWKAVEGYGKRELSSGPQIRRSTSAPEEKGTLNVVKSKRSGTIGWANNLEKRRLFETNYCEGFSIKIEPRVLVYLILSARI